MIFWRIFDNRLYATNEVDRLGFEEAEGLRIPDEYLEKKEFMVMRTAHGIGDWGIISAMPRLLKKKYPDCRVYVPTSKFIKQLFGVESNIPQTIFDNNPYVDKYKDFIVGEIFHDHYRVYNKDNSDIPLLEQMLKFWQFEEDEYIDSKPEMYWSDEEKSLGDTIIKNTIGDDEFGCLLVSDRFGTQRGKHHQESYDKDTEVMTKVLEENQMPYFYWMSKPISQTPFNFIDKALDMRHIDLRVQLYIKSKAKVNLSNQCGTNHLMVRYSKCYESQRQYPIAHNFVRGETYL
tara:strand:+ start:62 stop:931 length:870 start_codon:yes stop_codon:yes gene_type:complete